MAEWWRKNRKLLVGVVLVLAALLGYSLGLQPGDQTGWFERLALRLGRPLLSATTTLRLGVAGFWGGMVPGGSSRDLDAENRQLRAELAAAEELRRENERLRRLLGFVEEAPQRPLAARVIAEDASSWFRTIIIDRGSEEGVVEGLPVVNAAGLIGRVVRSTAHSARVLLITDASSAVAVLVQDQRIRGVCRGQGGALALDFALVQDEIQVGDGVVTSGLGGVFPKGLVVGYVRSVHREQFGLFQTVEVEPAVDFAHLEEVLVLLREAL
jgi:rod shape-determining protein MreC